MGSSAAYVRMLIGSSGLFEVGVDGYISSHLISRRAKRVNGGADEAVAGVSHKVEIPQVPERQAKSLSYHDQEHDREREREREHEREHNLEKEQEKELDVVDNARKALIDFGPDADDVDFLKFCIDKIFSQSMWLQSLAAEGKDAKKAEKIWLIREK